MAIVKFVASGCPMNNIFPYVMNWGKTDENLISGINCSPDTALQEFTFVKKQFKKEDGRTYVHIVQAFSPDDDLAPEVAHEIGLRFAEYTHLSWDDKTETLEAMEKAVKLPEFDGTKSAWDSVKMPKTS